MSLTNRRIFLASLKLYDLALLTICYAAATVFTFQAVDSNSLAQFLSIRVKLSNCLIFAGMLIAWHVLLSLCRLYESKRLATLQEAIAVEFKATSAATAFLLLVAVIFRIRMVTPAFLVMFWSISTVGMTTSRIVLRALLRQVRGRGRDFRHMLIVGTNPRAIAFARSIAATPAWGYRNLGFVDYDWSGSDRFKQSGFTMATNRAGLPEFLRNNVVDEVAIYLPLRSCYEDAAQVASLCGQHGITVRCESDIFGLHALPAWNADIDEEHVVATLSAKQDGVSLLLKRTLDIVGAVSLLTILSPLLAFVALLIKMTSKGPVFFRQERIGINKRRFRIFKFRTMVSGAESLLANLEQFNEVSGPVFKIKKDPRITPLGTWLRRTSIDELPQLLNVLKGDMSMVGPRPLPIRDYQGFGQDWQRRRFCVRPGITCLWQVEGRSSIGFEQWMKLDLQYLDQWSLWLDLKILARTIPAVLKGTGAA